MDRDEQTRTLNSTYPYSGLQHQSPTKELHRRVLAEPWNLLTKSHYTALIFPAILLWWLWHILEFRIKIYLRTSSLENRHRKVITLQHSLPILGHAVYFAWDMRGFASKVKKRFEDIPLRIRLMVMDVVFLSNPKDIAFVFRNSTQLTNNPYREFVSNSFGVPRSFKEFFARDNSGFNSKPRPESNVKPEHRIDYLMHDAISKFMTGPSLKPLAARFTNTMTWRFKNLGDCDEWTDELDLYNFVQEQMFHSSIQAMFGEQIFKLNPNFCGDFRRFDAAVPDLAKGVPRFLNPSNFEARDKCLASVRKWQNFLDKERERIGEDCTSLEYDPVFGSGLVKKRHKVFSKIEIMGSEAKTSEDLALIWGCNSNVTSATFWLIFETIHNPKVLKKFLDAIKPAQILTHPNGLLEYDVPTLCASYFLQSLYAEVLRTRVANIILRRPLYSGFNIRGWQVPKGDIMCIMSVPMHYDEKVFNTGTVEEPHLIHEFWAERFLVSQNDISPVENMTPKNKSNGDDRSTVENSSTETKTTRQQFSTKGLEESWIPYGGGVFSCPGKHYAKQEMLLTAALLIGNFEMEFFGATPVVDERYFGVGVLGVKGAQKFRMKRRLETL